MPIKIKERLLNQVLAANGTSSWVNVENYKDFMFALKMATTSGSGSDTLDCYIETSSTNDPAQAASNIRALVLKNALTGTRARKFDQVTGGLTLPADTNTTTLLRQQWDYDSPNVDEYVRLRYTVAGTPANLGTVIVDMFANKET